MTPHHDTARDILSALEQRKGFRDLASLFLPETVERIVEEVASIIGASQGSQDRLRGDATRAPTDLQGWLSEASKQWAVVAMDAANPLHVGSGSTVSHPSTDGEGA